jgi:hypothetical protein
MRFYRESNTIDIYKDTIRYLIDNHGRYYTPGDKQLAMDHPSQFLKVQKKFDSDSSNYKTFGDVAANIIGKWEANARISKVSPDNSELRGDCRKIMQMGLKIHAIKAFRIATGYGLKESKDIVESL